jgi:hypothetical protein
VFARSSHLGARSGERNDDDNFQKGKEALGVFQSGPRVSQSTTILRQCAVLFLFQFVFQMIIKIKK